MRRVKVSIHEWSGFGPAMTMTILKLPPFISARNISSRSVVCSYVKEKNKKKVLHSKYAQ